MIAVPVIIYTILCLMVAYRGRKTQIGYIGTFLLSIFLTPVATFIGLLLLTPSPEDVQVVYHQPPQKV